MAALTDSLQTRSKDLGVQRRYLMAVSTTIYSGSMVMLNASGLAVPASAIASNQGVIGLATTTVTSPASGDTFIVVQEGTFRMAATTIADTTVGLAVYAEDDQTIDETQGANEPQAGILVEVVDASTAWVKMGIGSHGVA